MGTALITESCVLNPNRNPGWPEADAEAELGPLLGLDKIIWLPGIAGRDITYGHTDWDVEPLLGRHDAPSCLTSALTDHRASEPHEPQRICRLTCAGLEVWTVIDMRSNR